MKRFVTIVGIVLGVLVVLAAAGWLSIGFILSPQNSLEKVDALVAISGGDTEARAAEAIRLYQEGWASTIVFSGAAFDSSSPSNAQAMQRQALAAGVPASAIVLEESAVNTQQNADGVARLARERSYTKIILVTSPYHQRRAYLSFRQALGRNTTILNHSAPDQTWRRSRWWATPYSRQLTWAELRKTLFVIATGPSS